MSCPDAGHRRDHAAVPERDRRAPAGPLVLDDELVVVIRVVAGLELDDPVLGKLNVDGLEAELPLDVAGLSPVATLYEKALLS